MSKQMKILQDHKNKKWEKRKETVAENKRHQQNQKYHEVWFLNRSSDVGVL